MMLDGTAVPAPKRHEKIADSLARGSAECSLWDDRFRRMLAHRQLFTNGWTDFLWIVAVQIPRTWGFELRQINPGRFTGDDGGPPMFDVLANFSATQWRDWYLDTEQAIEDVPAVLFPFDSDVRQTRLWVRNFVLEYLPTPDGDSNDDI